MPTIADGTKSSALLRSVSSLGQGKELWEALMWSSWLKDNDLLCKDYSGFILLIFINIVFISDFTQEKFKYEKVHCSFIS